MQGIRSKSRVERATMVKYYAFLILNVFLVFTLGSALSVYLETLATTPSIALYMFSLEIASGASFFINWLILNLLSFPISLLGPFNLLHSLAKQLSFTPRSLNNILFYTSYVSFGILYPINVLAITIVFVYSSLAPLITIPGTIYFAVAWLVYKHQFINVYIKEHDGQGKHFKIAFDYTILGLIIMQIVFYGVLASKKPSFGVWVCLVLLPGTLLFWNYSRRRFFNKLGVLALSRVSNQVVDLGLEHVGDSVVMLVNSPQEVSMDPARVAKIQSIDRHASTYMNPLFSQKLSRPWIPDVLADWIRSGTFKCKLSQVIDEDEDDGFENSQDIKDKMCDIDQEEV